jgi:hypothetical protein
MNRLARQAYMPTKLHECETSSRQRPIFPGDTRHSYANFVLSPLVLMAVACCVVLCVYFALLVPWRSCMDTPPPHLSQTVTLSSSTYVCVVPSGSQCCSLASSIGMLALIVGVGGRDSRYKGEIPFRVPSREGPDLSSERSTWRRR